MIVLIKIKVIFELLLFGKNWNQVKSWWWTEIVYSVKIGSTLVRFQYKISITLLEKGIKRGSFLLRQLMITNCRVKKFVKKSQ